jgi:hypothetical protein
MRWVGLAALAAAAACATAGERAAQEPPPSFRAVRSLVLARTPDDRAGRPKDPLDGLDESLRARGYETRIVELGAGRKPELARLDGLFGKLETRAATPRGERFGPAPTGEAGAAAGDVVADLGVDAVVTYHRLEGRRFLAPPAPPPPTFAGTYASQPQALAPRTAQGAFALVDRTGHVAVFPWGESGATAEPEGAMNAAEAIDQLLRVLTGEPADAE